MTTADHVCPVGHPDNWQCIEARVYGPCDHPNCGGVCEVHEDCTCPCHKPAPVSPERTEPA